MVRPTKVVNRVEEVNSVILTKKYIVVYTDDNFIIVRDDNNVQCWPGAGKLYAEFDTVEELDSFISENNLVDFPEPEW